MADEFDDPGAEGFYDSPEEEIPSYDDAPPMAPEPPRPKANYRVVKQQQQAQPPRQQPQPQMERAPVRARPQQIPQQTQAPQAQAQAGDRFLPFEMPKRIGLFDRDENRAIVEDEDMQRVIIAMLADIKNQLQRIETSLA